MDAFIQAEGCLRGAAYKGTTELIGDREAYGIINTKLESLLEYESIFQPKPFLFLAQNSFFYRNGNFIETNQYLNESIIIH